MTYCPYCKSESNRVDVCTECGVVFKLREIIIYDPNMDAEWEKEKKSEPLYNEFFGELSPDIEYRHKYATHAKGKELNRALRRQKKKYFKKPESFFYKQDYTKIGRICSSLRLSNVVKNEALNLRKQIGKFHPDYFKRNNLYKIIACIKLACRVYDFQIEERDLISQTGECLENKNLKGNKCRARINREYMELLKITKLRFERFPEVPNYIPYICNKLDLFPSDEYFILKRYQDSRKYLKPNFNLKGYILAIIYVMCKDNYKIRLTDLEKISGVSKTTIASRVRGLKKIWRIK